MSMDAINFTSCHIGFHPITVLANNPQELIVGDLETFFFVEKLPLLVAATQRH